MKADTQSFVPLSVASILQGATGPDEPSVRVDLYTDPISAWCWANEPAWLAFTETYGSHLAIDFRMVGLVQDFEVLDDDGPTGNAPSQLAMQWEEASHASGMPLDSDIWFDDPPTSSWPGCAAVKAASFQSGALADTLLRRLRRAVICEGRDLASVQVLTELAIETELDIEQLARDLESGRAGEAFAADMDAAAEFGEMVAPSYVFTGSGGEFVLRGGQPLSGFVNALTEAAGAPAEPLADPSAIDDRHGYIRALLEARGHLTAAEAGAVLSMDPTTAADLLDRMGSGGNLRFETVGRGRVYFPV